MDEETRAVEWRGYTTWQWHWICVTAAITCPIPESLPLCRKGHFWLIGAAAEKLYGQPEGSLSGPPLTHDELIAIPSER